MAICGFSSVISISISLVSIYLQLTNYRKPFQQRLILRILIMVPIYSITCFTCLVLPTLIKYVEPIREIYELFVIYTFFELLAEMLGGEREIMYSSVHKPPVPIPILGHLDLSDPYHFRAVKIGILQYVWLKPLICLTILLCQFTGHYDVNDIGFTSTYLWIGLLYNFSATLSLSCLAIFWRCLYEELSQFKPWGKFLCVKLIIFASYWQGGLLAILNFLNLLPSEETSDNNNIAIMIQNLILSVELIFFAMGHLVSFDYHEFDNRLLPGCAKLKLPYLVRDFIGIKDLILDFRNSINGENWTYERFDSERLPLEETSKIKRINKGMRFSHGGTQKYWISNNHVEYIQDDLDTKDEKLYQYVKKRYPFGDLNYPVEVDIDSYVYSNRIQLLRENVGHKYGSVGEV